jgi:hypothetical protein
LASGLIKSSITVSASSTYTIYLDLHSVVGNVELFVDGTLTTSSSTTGMNVSAYSGTGPISDSESLGLIPTITTLPPYSLFATNAGVSEDVSFTASSGASQTKVSCISLIRKEIGDWAKVVITNRDTAVAMTANITGVLN